MFEVLLASFTFFRIPFLTKNFNYICVKPALSERALAKGFIPEGEYSMIIGLLHVVNLFFVLLSFIDFFLKHKSFLDVNLILDPILTSFEINDGFLLSLLYPSL